ncbi:class I SAM-dependent methyltransferase [Dyella sp.]|jgi:2-polyprenyl-3-methyl-5-hydroxy-6-metoxy-1,4-benzoquinol methylase|uniref:class I SAM-dependent methyltransferase n=1 Tax=Dyella sp. TaxID=1869338 RepID=UPI002D76E4E2|nr:methyltransferase domain-containing protein [Dyella sp.]HET6431043.1 methyltransferase domain-containing protein [Dyella sp.]
MRQADASAEQAIVEAWHRNAAPWTRAVRQGVIESRRRVTDAAIVDAVLARRPGHVIDLGCGEGWLMRALAERGVGVLGVDAVPELVASAAGIAGCRAITCDYAAVAAGALEARADVVVCNFSLIGGDSVDALLRAIPTLLHPRGALLIQTLHPWSACGEAPYRDGWREGSWAGCGDGFAAPAPWYFRTMGGWMASFAQARLQLAELAEPLHPDTGRPTSVLFTLLPEPAPMG